MGVDEINAGIGKKIRNLRNRNGLTQQELADRTELTKGFISQLERGQVSPSVATLLDLIECLGTTASEFFRKDEPTAVVFREQEFFEKVDEEGNVIEWIVPTAQNNEMEPLRVEIRPGKSLKEDKPHSGEEFGYVLSGQIRLILDEEIFTVNAGESFYYKATRDHRIENPGRENAVLIWVSTPPNF